MHLKAIVTIRSFKILDHWRDISEDNYVSIAQRIQADEIDILIDLTGYTRHCKPEVFALEPAPIQIHYLGYPSTMGADFLPYIIADEYLIPPELENNYSEKIISLNQGWVVSPLNIEIEQTPSKSDCGLPEDGVIFANFNTSYKLNPMTFKMWMNILKVIGLSL